MFVGCVENFYVDLLCGSRCSTLRFAQGIDNFCALLGNLFVILFPGCRNFLEHFLKTRLTKAVFRREISPADKRLEIWGQPDTHGPAAAAGGRLHKSHVNPIDIGPFFTIDFNVHEFAIHDRGYFLAFEGFVRHDVTPVAS